MKKLMFLAAMLGFAVACGGANKAENEAVEEVATEVVAPEVEEAPVVEQAPAVEQAPKAEAPKAEAQKPATPAVKEEVKLEKPADVSANEKVEKPAAIESGMKVNTTVKVVEKKEEEKAPIKIEQAGSGAKRVKK